MRVLVCGGRGFSDTKLVDDTLTRVHLNSDAPITLLIEGGAPGADRLARQWAKGNGIHVATVEALWDFYGNSAGPRRNTAMLNELSPHAIVAFPGGRGTADMVKKALGAKVPLIDAAISPDIAKSAIGAARSEEKP